MSITFAGAEILYSNLGGQGPDTPTGASAGSEAIRYVNIGGYYLPDGSARFLDLVLSSLDSYTPYNSSLNGL